MLKYLTLLKLSWQNGLVYRTSLALWRIRNFLSSLMSLTIWSVLFQNQQSIAQYQRNEMISYIFLISLLQSIILATSLHGLANDIYHGNINQLMVKPINIFAYLTTQEIADKLKNIFFVLIEIIALYFIFKPSIAIPDLPHLALFIISLFTGLILYFLLKLLIGTIGFWSPESWAPNFLLMTMLTFTAGKLYPINILPQILQKILFLTPFPYFSYIQTQIYLEKTDINQSMINVGISLIWVIVLFIIFRKVWNKGIKD